MVFEGQSQARLDEEAHEFYHEGREESVPDVRRHQNGPIRHSSTMQVGLLWSI